MCCTQWHNFRQAADFFKKKHWKIESAIVPVDDNQRIRVGQFGRMAERRGLQDRAEILGVVFVGERERIARPAS